MDYHACNLCPRKCGVDRTAGKLGFCRMNNKMKIARAAAHYWEEPVISGNYGSGTVFFSGCTLGCIYCQNEKISHQNCGKEITSSDLRKIFEQLIEDGVQNINLVTPTQFLPDILPALTPKLPVPIVYNCGGYESVDTLRQLEGLIDIYLPDLKYSSRKLAADLSKAPDYFETATKAILEMYRQTGPVVIEDEEMKRGVLLRHLILPGQIDNSLGVLDWVADHFRHGEILFSLMSQYTPMPAVEKIPELNRTVTELEYDAVLSYLHLLGIEDGYTQDFLAASQSYIPDWDLCPPDETNICK